MLDFWEKRFDVLVCTTIVESGLDVSNANTMIIERSDTLGLSQLHQLRGRVGRSRERAYAYFLYPAEKPLTETAHERLATLAQHSDLGGGMAIAMKDLEIRGAGNLLGGEQSGHIADVGFDLYVRLVGEAVAEFKGGAERGARRGPHRAARRRPPAARLHPERAAAAGDVQAARRGAHRRRRRRAPRGAASTATAPPPEVGGVAARRRALPRPGPRRPGSARSRWPASTSGSRRSTCPSRASYASSGCTRRASSRRRSARSSCRDRRRPRFAGKPVAGVALLEWARG